MRLAWILLPISCGAAISHLLDHRSSAVGLVASALIFGGWGVGLVAALVPDPRSLTALRVLAPAAVLASTAAALRPATPTWAAALGLAGALLAVIAVIAPVTVDAFVDGGSYGPEQRWALRVPTGLLLGPVPFALALVIGGLSAGPLLLAARHWALGGLALVAGVPLAIGAIRAIHHLALRWLVLVPGGMVLHDRAVLADPILFARGAVVAVAPATVGTTATDLTLGAHGLVLFVALAEPVEAARRTGRQRADTVHLQEVLVSPVRPGAFLREAGRHCLPVG
jgi:hypothetical protein